MKVSRSQREDNRRRILYAASRLFRDRGFDAVSVSEVMKAAGMTHGGFYGHFASKDDLIAQTIVHALATKSGELGDFRGWLATYLSVSHRDHAADGCPTASLAASLRQQSPQARTALADGLHRQIEGIVAALPDAPQGDRRRAALGIWSAMVGAVVLARAIEDPTLSEEVLDQTRAWIEQGLDRLAAGN